MPDIHRHDEFSSFDGFGNPTELAKLAKELGYTALGIANHGSVSGLVLHYKACREEGIKPILGVEAYFLPVFKKQRKKYHLCLFAKNLQGYQNIMKIMTIAEMENKYYSGTVTFELLEKYHEGIICTSACLAGYTSQAILAGNMALARKSLVKFKEIFGDDFYIEIQPYDCWDNDDIEVQKDVNLDLMGFAYDLDIKCIMTSDSHYGRKEDFDTYLKMHEIGNHNYDIVKTYGERYMPTYAQLGRRFVNIYGESSFEDRFNNGVKEYAKQMLRNLKEIENKVESDILEDLPLLLPKLDDKIDSTKLLKEKIQAGMKKRGKTSKGYLDRVKQEFDVIKYHGFEDYFLIVADYVNFAKDNDIEVGPGRGSVCNCQIAYFLGITEVDSYAHKLDFRRFLRKDKKKLPDIDLDFETSKRQIVIDYLIDKYPGHASQIASYGLYQVDNLLNDLVKVCGVPKDEIKVIKSHASRFVEKNGNNKEMNLKSLNADSYTIYLNKIYKNIFKHFTKLYKNVRYMSVHAGGVAITGGNITDYLQLRLIKEKPVSCYNLNDVEFLNVIKFDILGLKTESIINNLKNITNDAYDESWLQDPECLKNFAEGKTDAIFQYESSTAKEILRMINANNFKDVVVASALNRPGPLNFKTHELYASQKLDGNFEHDLFYKYTKDTYGTLVFQEQLQQICVNIGGLSWADADKVMKALKNVGIESVKEEMDAIKLEMTDKFVIGAVKKGIPENEAREMFTKLLVYSFNEGHATGYTIVSFQEMYYRCHYPIEFWSIKLKYTTNEKNIFKYKVNAIMDGAILFLPHVNYSAYSSLRKIEDDTVIQEGLTAIKGIGAKAAESIEKERNKNGPFRSKEEFIKRCRNRAVHKGVIKKLDEKGALEFSKKRYISRCVKYNATFYAKG